MDEKLNLSDLLVFNREKGRISLWDYRMVMFSARAWTCLRQELVESIGSEAARGVLKRFGYEAGAADGQALLEQLPFLAENPLEMLQTLVCFTGFSAIQPDSNLLRPTDAINYLEGAWLFSCESGAERRESLSQEPVCWFLAGYMMGCMTAITRQPMLVVETDCRAMGHEHCRFVAGREEELPSWYSKELSEYQPDRLQARLSELEEHIENQNQIIDEQLARLVSHETTILALSDAVERETQPIVEPLPEQEINLIGTNAATRRMLETIRLIGACDYPVLIRGEPGSGKKTLARYLHQQSARRAGPFQTVNCGLLPQLIQQPELFGYLPGSFPGATRARTGFLEGCQGGILCLNEVEKLGLVSQAQLAQFLQSGAITPLGSTEEHQIDTRLVVATSADLKELVEKGRFQESLYKLLEPIEVRVAPLRQRGNDTLLLANHFLEKFNQMTGKNLKEIEPEAARALSEYHWPENVRELEEAIEHGVLIAAQGELRYEDLPSRVMGKGLKESHSARSGARVRRRSPGSPDKLAKYRAQVMALGSERQRVELALNLVGGHREQAARVLGVGRTTLWRRMIQWGLE